MGFFAKHKVDVQFHEVIGGHRAANMMLEGGADLATASEVVAMFNSFKRQDFCILSTFVSSTNDVKILARVESGISTLADLPGHRVGTVTGASAHFFLDETLILAGIDPNKVHLQHVQPEKTIEMLRDGKVDAMVMWEPWVYLASQKLSSQVTVIPHSKTYRETFNLLAKHELSQKEQPRLRRLHRALIDAVNYMHKYPSKVQRMVAKRFNKDIAVIQATWRDLVFDVRLDQWLLNTLESQGRWAISRGLVEADKSINYLSFVQPQILHHVAHHRVTLF
uniref:SsuA/THI5-like domain-containing protein n=1 Tax=Magnetococcus massalia (strain MO-1) TaxID=451514 RepID=A0A1S7LFF4_MAGMO|nr:conserved protein of unknown function [Candidatus Magnetococcus massalia]